MNRKLNLIAVALPTLICLFICGCNLNVITKIYTRDVFELCDSEENSKPLYVQGTFLVEVATANEENKNRAMDLLDGAIMSPKFVGWERDNLDTFIKISAKIPLCITGKSYKKSDLASVILLSAEKTKLPSGHMLYSFYCNVKKDLLSKIKQRVKEKFYQNLNFSDSKFNFVVSNDTREKNGIKPYVDLMLDGSPFLAGQEDRVVLAERDEVNFELTKVFSAAMEKHKSVHIMNLYKEDLLEWVLEKEEKDNK